jgi:Family of unknown function (DUF6152)
VRKRLVICCLAAFCFLLISVPLSAHHGNAAFDTAKPITVKATVTEWVWANPHCWLKFDVTDEKGNVVHWIAETTPPTDLVDRGWTRETFKAGDQITVTMLTSKGGRPVGRINSVVLPNGQTLGNQPNVAPPAPSKP